MGSGTGRRTRPAEHGTLPSIVETYSVVCPASVGGTPYNGDPGTLMDGADTSPPGPPVARIPATGRILALNPPKAAGNEAGSRLRHAILPALW